MTKKTPPPEFQAVATRVRLGAEALAREGGRLRREANGYNTLPEGVRAFLARRVGVPDKRLDELTREERAKLRDEAKRLAELFNRAWAFAHNAPRQSSYIPCHYT